VYRGAIADESAKPAKSNNVPLMEGFVAYVTINLDPIS
jgi:hypothetical protein